MTVRLLAAQLNGVRLRVTGHYVCVCVFMCGPERGRSREAGVHVVISYLPLAALCNF